MKIVRLANFVTPRSGGLRTALRELGAGYLAAGHSPTLIIPGDHYDDGHTRQGRVITLPGPTIPGTGGYRVIAGRKQLRRRLEALEPDLLEVSDRTTLRWTGAWAKAHGVRSMMVSHESLDGILRLFGPGRRFARRTADYLNHATAESYDTVTCTTSWAAAEFQRIGAPNLSSTQLGVDLDCFRPDRHEERVRQSLAPNGELLLVHCGRLSPEKLPELSIDALAALRRRNIPAVLVIAGDGPRRPALEVRATQLPVRFLGFVSKRGQLARLLATADIALAPGPVETFGLAALEALASGTPVVINARSALPEVIAHAGLAVQGGGEEYAGAVEKLVTIPRDVRRARARARAEQFSWPAAVKSFLTAHGIE